jgi:hypothetical protein
VPSFILFCFGEDGTKSLRSNSLPEGTLPAPSAQLPRGV